MKNKSGLTLVELLIAILILAFLALAAGGIYLTGFKMFNEARFSAQAKRNAMIAMSHIEKKLKKFVAFYDPTQTMMSIDLLPGELEELEELLPLPTIEIVRFITYADPPDFNDLKNNVKSAYYWDMQNRTILYSDQSGNFGPGDDAEIIANHVTDFQITPNHNEPVTDTTVIVFDVTITATNNNETTNTEITDPIVEYLYKYTLNSQVEARQTAYPLEEIT